MDEYVTEFVQDAEEAITELNNELLRLEREPANRDAMDGIFRTAHTLKGNCAAMGFTTASTLAHAIEDVLDAVRAGDVSITAELMDHVFEAVDVMESLIEEIGENGEAQSDPDETIDALRSIVEAIDEPQSERPYASPTDEEIDRVLERFVRPNDDVDVYLVRLEIHREEGVNNGLLVVEALADAFDLIGTVPSRSAIEDESYGEWFDAIFSSAVGEGAIASALEPVEEVTDFDITRVTERLDESAETGTDSVPGMGLSESEARDMAVDDLLDQFDEFDDLDSLVEEVGDVSAFEDMGEAGSFADLLGDEYEELTGRDLSVAEESSEPGSEADDVVDDASAVFEELKAEVEMVSFDELQKELDELEFEEFDGEDEVGFDELLGDAYDEDDTSFLGVGEEPAGQAADDERAADGAETVPVEADDETVDGVEEVDDGVDETVEASAETTDSAEAAAPADGDVADGTPTDDGGAAAGGDEAVDESEATPTDDAASEIEDEAIDESFDPEAAFDVGRRGDGDADRRPGEGNEDDAHEFDPQVAFDHGEDFDLDDGFDPDAAFERRQADDEVEDGEREATVDADEVPETEDEVHETEDALEIEDEVPEIEDEVPEIEGEDVLEVEDGFDLDATLDADEEIELDADLDDGADLDEFELEEDELEEDVDDEFELEEDVDLEQRIDLDADAEPSLPEYDVEYELETDSTRSDSSDEPDDGLSAVETASAGDVGDAGVDAEEPSDESAMARRRATRERERVDVSFDDSLTEAVAAAAAAIDDHQEHEGDASADADVEQVQSVRVSVDQLDSLMNLVEGLVTSRVRLRHSVDNEASLAELDDELDDLEDITTELQEAVMDIRLMPLGTITGRLPRIVRDIARQQDKEVRFEVAGEDVELDRSVLDEIGDPLVHLVRNAVDHGVESPDERTDRGKDAEGLVEVRADRDRDRVTIEVVDDGDGLDADRLREEAVEAGIYTAEEAQDLTDEEAHELVFHPGLSTADEVTDVSGRGVGMDVVKRAVDDLDGEVSIESAPGDGTTVRMSLPVTVAIADVMFVEAGGEQFGVPIKVINDVAPSTYVQTVDGEERFVREEEDECPLVRLDDVLETPREGVNGDGKVLRIRDDVRSIALHCDAVTGQQEVVVKPFEGFMADIPGLSGATVRGRGDVVNILDVTTL